MSEQFAVRLMSGILFGIPLILCILSLFNKKWLFGFVGFFISIVSPKSILRHSMQASTGIYKTEKDSDELVSEENINNGKLIAIYRFIVIVIMIGSLFGLYMMNSNVSETVKNTSATSGVSNENLATILDNSNFVEDEVGYVFKSITEKDISDMGVSINRGDSVNRFSLITFKTGTASKAYGTNKFSVYDFCKELNKIDKQNIKECDKPSNLEVTREIWIDIKGKGAVSLFINQDYFIYKESNKFYKIIQPEVVQLLNNIF